jgi:hypothetical protein
MAHVTAINHLGHLHARAKLIALHTDGEDADV